MIWQVFRGRKKKKKKRVAHWETCRKFAYLNDQKCKEKKKKEKEKENQV